MKFKANRKISNGKIILNTDGKVVLCITDGKYYTYKQLDEDKVQIDRGVCSYDGETGDFNIISGIDTLNKQISEFKKEIEDLKEKSSNIKYGMINTLEANYNYEIELGFRPVYVQVLVIRAGLLEVLMYMM